MSINYFLFWVGMVIDEETGWYDGQVLILMFSSIYAIGFCHLFGNLVPLANGVGLQ